MHGNTVDILYRPKLKAPILIAGFRGWSDVLGVSTGLLAYLIRKLNSDRFARLSTDHFFQYDRERPSVTIEHGTINNYRPSGGSFYAVTSPDLQRDLIIFRGDEPGLAWDLFARTVFDLCEDLGVDTAISIGGVFDQVLHTERLISSIVSNPALLQPIKRFGVVPTSYSGPAAIHTVLQETGTARKLDCYSFWCHCPIYIQNARHYGYISDLGNLIAQLGDFNLDVGELELSWQKMVERIDHMVAQNEDLQEIVRKIESSSAHVPAGAVTPASVTDSNVIDLKDFLPPPAPEQP